MRMSMAIIEHWIREYHPISTIVDDDLTIYGIRLFSYNKKLDLNYLYIGRNKDFFDRSGSNEVLLVHRNSVMSLQTEDLEDVFDLVMDGFAFYEKWEQKLYQAYQDSNPEAALIEACTDILGPMFFTNPSLQVTAFSRSYPKGSINKNWNDFWEIGTLSLTSLERMKNSLYMQKITGHWRCELFEEKNVTRYPYSMMISQENSAHILTGQLTVISQKPFETWQIHLASVLRQALCMAARNETFREPGSLIHNLYLDFLSGSAPDSGKLQTFCQLQGWPANQTVAVILLTKDRTALAAFAYYKKNLQREFPVALICTGMELPGHPEDEVICTLPLRKLSWKELKSLKPTPENRYTLRYGIESPAAFLKEALRSGLMPSVSFPMEGVSHLKEQYQQAVRCADNKKAEYYECALQDFVSLSTPASMRQLAIHPILYRILYYDQQKHTEYYEMLKQYLRLERDRVKTAEALFIHKNTLVYRLQKLERLFGLDLDSPYEREYLLYSMRSLEK